MSLRALSVRPLSRPMPLLAGLAIAAAAVLYFYDPSHSSFYPGCMFYRLTGLLCPGCGSLRALHQLLHGHLATAFRCNPLLVLVLIPVAAFGAVEVFRSSNPAAADQTKWRKRLLRPAALWMYVMTVVIFGIMRNLPGPLFDWLRP